MNKNKRNLVSFAASVAFYLLLVGGYVVWAMRAEERETLKWVDASLLRSAMSLRHMLAEDFHDRATGPGAISRDEELANRRALSGFAAESGFQYVYTLVEKDGGFYFTAPTVTEEEAKERDSWYFYPYEDAPGAFSLALADKTPQYATYSDQWGTFRSVALPLRSPGGNWYLACADLNISDLDKELAGKYLQAFMTAGLFLVGSLPLLWAFRRSFSVYSEELRTINEDLLRHKSKLEDIVQERTSELNAAKEQAEKANEAKSVFLAKMSHEIRTPIYSISALTDLELAQSADPQRRSRLLKLKEVVSHLTRLISDILDLSRIEAGQEDLRDEDFDLHALLGSLVGQLRLQALDKGLGVSLDIAKDTPRHVRGDEQRLSQVIMNLGGNAVKYTPSGGVRLEVRPGLEDGTGGREVRFAVIDTGPGIPEDMRQEVFKSFRQLDDTLTRGVGGSGLGLAISRQLVEMMGGEISVNSAPGGGSMFTFTVALRPGSPGPESQAQTGRPGARHPRKILLAEDNTLNAHLASEILAGMGHEPHVRTNGLEAVEALSAERFDLVLMDLEMPVADGLMATRMIRSGEAGETARHTPIIGVSAHALPEIRRAALDAGMDAYVTKPMDFELLESYFESVITRKEAAGLPQAGSGPGRTRAVLRSDKALAKLLGNQDLLDKALEAVRQDIPAAMETIRAAMDAEDMDAAQKACHRLAGSLGTIGAERAEDAARDFMAACRSDSDARGLPWENLRLELLELSAHLSRDHGRV